MVSRTKKSVIFIAIGVPYLCIGYVISLMTLVFSAMANGPCETNDCPEGVPPAWAWAIPIAFGVGFLLLTFKGVSWIVRRDTNA